MYYCHINSREGHPQLYLTKAGVAYKFMGKEIPAICTVVAIREEKTGNWEHTEYGLILAPGVVPLIFRSLPHGKWGVSLCSWEVAANRLDLSLEETQRIVRIEDPVTAARLDQLEPILERKETS